MSKEVSRSYDGPTDKTFSVLPLWACVKCGEDAKLDTNDAGTDREIKRKRG